MDAELSDANHKEILKAAADMGWTYEQTLNFVVTLGVCLIQLNRDRGLRLPWMGETGR